MSELIAVATFGSHILADLAKSAMDAAGIEAMVAADDGGRQNPHLDLTQGVVLLVRAEDVERARDVLAGATPEGASDPAE